MAATRAYLDYNASAPLLEAARSAVVAALGAANPSSVHAEGRAAVPVDRDWREIVGVPLTAIFYQDALFGADQAVQPSLSPLRGIPGA